MSSAKALLDDQGCSTRPAVRGWELGQPEAEAVLGRPNSSPQWRCMTVGVTEAREPDCSAVYGGRTWNTTLKLKREALAGYIEKHFPHEASQAVGLGPGRLVQSLPLETSEAKLDKALSNLVWLQSWACSEWEIGPHTTQSLFWVFPQFHSHFFIESFRLKETFKMIKFCWDITANSSYFFLRFSLRFLSPPCPLISKM